MQGVGSRQTKTDCTSAPSYFLNKLINFLGIGFSLYIIAALSQRFSEDPIIKHTVKCKYCRKRISEKVSPPPPPVVLSFSAG